ncbi:RagB/SusD family nutrient uptake outer membrane protein [Robertkochia solimangrovi]|uniref:RagB/SusD family nutrient uptake outer membrane protein n=1 Tax=Robertkochia solimangrovi TaxID=2213046 RepID=UPI00117FA2B3|nr:RagB/SusD family nutrient uptake outer membrane protein [Robertkochia solimangrovi]TRZ42446.1 RagB/SusD family nutrient uptake outer membrane protein [Robertkochia solimangrovi]
MKIKESIRLNTLLSFVTGWIIMSLTACSNFTEVDIPVSEQDAALIFSGDESAKSAMTGLYISMMNNFGHFGNMYTTYYAGLSSDEFQYIGTNTERVAMNENSLMANNSQVRNLWRDMFEVIYQANAVMEGLDNTDQVSDDLKLQLKGEALFMRAFTYFYLVNFFGDVPYVTTTDYDTNSTLSRMPIDSIYEEIIDDLLQSMEQLPEDYALSAGERIRPNYYAAKALLARIYLYTEDWDAAATMASEVIDQSSVYSLVPLSEVFLANNTEAIWQLYPVLDGFNTMEGYNFTCCVTNDFVLSENLLGSFETGDARRESWVNGLVLGESTYWYPYKYQVAFSANVTEYYTVLRLAEQYLIRAEAYAHSGLIDAALGDVNSIRSRAGLPSISLNNEATVLEAIAQERRIEFYAEWGHRWLDLKRTGQMEALNYKVDWEATDVWYPIPESELVLNQNLTQNEGY